MITLSFLICFAGSTECITLSPDVIFPDEAACTMFAEDSVSVWANTKENPPHTTKYHCHNFSDPV